MKGDIREFARVGLVHHLLYPKCTGDPEYYEETLKAFVAREDIETFDCALPFDEARRARLCEAIRASDKTDTAFALAMFPLRTISLATPDPVEQGVARMALADAARVAERMGSSGVVFASGGPPPEQAGPEHFEAFREMVRWFAGECARHGLRAWLEPFDTAIDKRVPVWADDAVRRVDRVAAARGDEPGDRARHGAFAADGRGFRRGGAERGAVPRAGASGQLRAEGSRVAALWRQASARRVARRRVRCGGVGDVSAGAAGGRFPERGASRSTLLEISPWPGRSVEETVEDNWRRVDEAWRLV